MKINEVEQMTGITKKNIRFYEEQGLLWPSRSENGYRNYSEKDIDALNKIKLLRKLSVPIDEIRKIQSNHLTLSDCLERHMIFLAHEEKNLILMQEMCNAIKEKEKSLVSLNAEEYLEKMQLLEKGGARFMDIGKSDIISKRRGSMAAAAVMMIFMAALIALLIQAEMEDPLPVGLFIFIVIVPAAVIVGVLLALKQRLKEIEKGEEYEASKY